METSTRHVHIKHTLAGFVFTGNTTFDPSAHVTVPSNKKQKITQLLGWFSITVIFRTLPLTFVEKLGKFAVMTLVLASIRTRENCSQPPILFSLY